MSSFTFWAIGTLMAMLLYGVGYYATFGAVNLIKVEKLGAHAGAIKTPVSLCATVGVRLAILLSILFIFLLSYVARYDDKDSLYIVLVVTIASSLPSLIVFALVIEILIVMKRIK